jgi:hypothetical protein
MTAAYAHAWAVYVLRSDDGGLWYGETGDEQFGNLVARGALELLRERSDLQEAACSVYQLSGPEALRILLAAELPPTPQENSR